MAATCLDLSWLGEDAEGEDGLQEGEQQQCGGAAVHRGAAKNRSLDVNETGLAAADVFADPRLVLRHSGVDSRSVGLSAALTEAHHSALHPPGAVFDHQGASRVALDTTTKVS